MPKGTDVFVVVGDQTLKCIVRACVRIFIPQADCIDAVGALRIAPEKANLLFDRLQPMPESEVPGLVHQIDLCRNARKAKRLAYKGSIESF